MSIYTAYYGGLGKMKLPEATLISISRSIPDYIKQAYPDMQHELLLAPSASLLNLYKNNYLSQSRYKVMYRNQLELHKVVPLLREWNNQPTPVVLLCYETPNDFCHRHVLAEIVQKCGISIEEVEYG